jgi:hypothetical protein
MARDAVRDEKDLLAWALSLGNLSPINDETMEQFRQRFGHYMLTEHDDPVAAREITMGKPIYDWSVMERAEFVLDYGNFFEGPHGVGHRCYSSYGYCKSTAGHKVEVIKHRRTRKGGAVASNPAEFLTLDGTQAGEEYANWDGKDPHWDGPRLKNAPRGFEEALLKRAACPTDDPEQGHLVHPAQGGAPACGSVYGRGGAASDHRGAAEGRDTP